MKHEFSPETDFCIRCDMSREEYIDLEGDCTETTNVVSFRHAKCKQWMDRMLALIMAAGDDELDWLPEAIRKLNNAKEV